MITPEKRLPVAAIVISVTSLLLAFIISVGGWSAMDQRQSSVEQQMGKWGESLKGWNTASQGWQKALNGIVAEHRTMKDDLSAVQALVAPPPAPTPTPAPKAAPKPAPEPKAEAAPAKPVPKPTPKPAPKKIPDPDGGYLETAGLRAAYEVLGFTFKTDGDDRLKGEYLTTTVTLSGHPHLSWVAVAGYARRNNNDANFAILAAIAAAANASASWGSQWVTDNMQNLIKESNDDRGREAVRRRSGDGVHMELAVTAETGTYRIMVTPS